MTLETMIKVRVLIVEVHTIVGRVQHLSLVTNATDIGHRAKYCEWVSPHNSNNTERKRDNYQNRNSCFVSMLSKIRTMTTISTTNRITSFIQISSDMMLKTLVTIKSYSLEHPIKNLLMLILYPKI